jgi:type IV secretion system protein VirB10
MSDKDKRTNTQDIDDAPLPLNTPRIAVSRINRKLVMSLLIIFGSIAALSLIWAVSPNRNAKEATGKPEASAKQSPNLPENVIDSPTSYKDLAKDGKVPQLGPPVTGDLGALQLQQQRELEAGRSLSAAADGKPAYTAYPASSSTANQAQLTPEQQAVHAAVEQRRKEYHESLRAPLSFGGHAMAAGGPSESQIAPAMPSIPGIDRLEAMSRKIGAGAPGGDDDQNMQEEKRTFAGEKRGHSPYLLAALQHPISRYELKAGTIIPSLLITGLNSDLPGQIVAQVRENVYDTVTGRFLLIPQGTRLVGEYDSKISYGQERALIVWSRLIMPNGNSISLEGMPGVDLSGYAGLKDRVNNHYGKLLTGVVLGSVIGAGAQVATGGQGSPNTPASFGQLAVSGAAQNINQAGQQITQKNLNLQPTIEIRPGMKLNVFVTKDMVLKPYSRI